MNQIAIMESLIEVIKKQLAISEAQANDLRIELTATREVLKNQMMCVGELKQHLSNAHAEIEEKELTIEDITSENFKLQNEIKNLKEKTENHENMREV